MPTNPNMVAIQTVTVGSGGAASISFTSIPQTYTDLKIVISGRDNLSNSINSDSINIQLNSTNPSSGIRLLGSGSSASSDTNTQPAWIANANSTASTFGNSEYYIPNYTGTTQKSISVDGVAETNATTVYMGLGAILTNVTSAVTSITILPSNGTSFDQYSTATLYGVTSAGYGAKATGGIITSDANYYYHTFLASGTFTPTSNITADYLVVAGGGGGSTGGGGAGGLRCTVTATGGGGSLESALSLTASTNYTVTVGAGGAGTAQSENPGGTNGTSGSNSVFSSITSTGGGGGGANKVTGSTGGSGGGGGFTSSTPLPSGGTGTANQGYAGGATSSSSSPYPAGGGGGANATGGAGTGSTGGAGGAGIATSISGSSVTYAGGGGGGIYISGGGTAGSGGTGGGGAGSSTGGNGTAGTANTGGGGGGAGQGSGSTGGAGGSGIVIVRYAK